MGEAACPARGLGALCLCVCVCVCDRYCEHFYLKRAHPGVSWMWTLAVWVGMWAWEEGWRRMLGAGPKAVSYRVTADIPALFDALGRQTEYFYSSGQCEVMAPAVEMGPQWERRSEQRV